MQEVKFDEKFTEFKNEFAVFQGKNPGMKLDPNTGKIAQGWEKLTEAFKVAEKDSDGAARATIVGVAFSPIKTEDEAKPSGWVPCSFKLGNSIFAVNAPTMLNGCNHMECPSTVMEFMWWWKQNKGESIKISKCEDGKAITLSTSIRARVKNKDGKREWADVSSIKPKVIEWR